MPQKMTGTNLVRRAIALRTARDKANNPEFKKLWDQKLRDLILHSEKSYDTIH